MDHCSRAKLAKPSATMMRIASVWLQNGTTLWLWPEDWRQLRASGRSFTNQGFKPDDYDFAVLVNLINAMYKATTAAEFRGVINSAIDGQNDKRYLVAQFWSISARLASALEKTVLELYCPNTVGYTSKVAKFRTMWAMLQVEVAAQLGVKLKCSMIRSGESARELHTQAMLMARLIREGLRRIRVVNREVAWVAIKNGAQKAWQ